MAEIDEIAPRRTIFDDGQVQLVLVAQEDQVSIIAVHQANSKCQTISFPWAAVPVIAEDLPQYRHHCGQAAVPATAKPENPPCKRCGTKRYSAEVLETMNGHCYRCHDQTTYEYCTPRSAVRPRTPAKRPAGKAPPPGRG